MGPPGVGKSRVGAGLARAMGVEFVDLDVEIGDVAGLFAAQGEEGFRRLEMQALARCAGGGGVLALGGGTLESAGAAALLGGWQRVVLLASVPTLLARLGTGEGRPLFAEGVEPVLRERMRRRMWAWRSFGVVIHTDGLDVDGVVRRIVEVV